MVWAVRAELRKIFTTRLWWGMAAGMMALAAAISAGFAALVGTSLAQNPTSGANPFAAMTVGTAQLIYNAGLVQNFTTLFPLAVGVLLITTEFRHQTITATFLSTPRRWVVLASKAVAVLAIGVIYAIGHAAASVAGGAGVLVLAKDAPTLLDRAQVWQSLGTGLVAFTVWTLLGFGFGMLVRNQIAAVLVAVGTAFLGQIALNIIFRISEWTTAAKFLPGNLTTGMLISADPTAGQGAGPPIHFDHWWVSALVLVGYAAALAIAGTVLTARRDIT